MKTSSIIAFAAAGAARLASAHTTVYAIWVNDVDQGLGNSASGYIRSPPSNSPITDVTSASMTCNTNNAATSKTVEVAGGDKITFEWHHNDRSAGDDIIDPSHKGPVMVYIAPTESNGAGDVWVKLAEDGYDGSWGVDRLIAAKGKHSITLPNLKAGTYLLRPEIIALHEGDRANGAQFYMECVQIKVTSAGTTSLPAGVAIPGTYTATDPGVLFDLYNGFTSYPIPGPKVWDGASSGSTPASSAKPASSAPAAASSKPAVVAPSSTKKAATSVAAVTSKAAAATSYLAFPTSVPAPPASIIKTTLVTLIKTKTAVAPAPSATGAASSGAVKQYYQCGGNNYTGATECAAGLTCKFWNEWYSQCL